jgi:hypothetical protein
MHPVEAVNAADGSYPGRGPLLTIPRIGVSCLHAVVFFENFQLLLFLYRPERGDCLIATKTTEKPLPGGAFLCSESLPKASTQTRVKDPASEKTKSSFALSSLTAPALFA